MISPLIFEGLGVNTYNPDEDAMFEAYLDIQQEVDQEDFALDKEQDIIEFLRDELFKD